MKMLSSPAAVLFDLDDTLIDRCASLRRYASVLAGVFGDRLAPCNPAELEALILAADGRYGPGDDAAAELARLLPWRAAPAAAAELAACWNTHFPGCAEATSGLWETLAWLRAHGLRTGIVTNGAVAWQTPKIERLGLPGLVDCVVVSEAVGVRKPDPRIFKHALDAIGVAPRHAWFVGDRPIDDIGGAAAVGMMAVWFRRRGAWPAGLPPPAAQIEDLGELVPLLESALAR